MNDKEIDRVLKLIENGGYKDLEWRTDEVLLLIKKARQDEASKMVGSAFHELEVVAMKDTIAARDGDIAELKARWEKLKKYSHDYCLKRNRCALVWQKMQELESIGNRVPSIPQGGNGGKSSESKPARFRPSKTSRPGDTSDDPKPDKKTEEAK